MMAHQQTNINFLLLLIGVSNPIDSLPIAELRVYERGQNAVRGSMSR
jgi:hypothetical protein